MPLPHSSSRSLSGSSSKRSHNSASSKRSNALRKSNSKISIKSSPSQRAAEESRDDTESQRGDNNHYNTTLSVSVTSSKHSNKNDNDDASDIIEYVGEQKNNNKQKKMNLNSFIHVTKNSTTSKKHNIDPKCFDRRSVATAPLPRLSGNSNITIYGNSSSKSVNKIPSSKSRSNSSDERSKVRNISLEELDIKSLASEDKLKNNTEILPSHEDANGTKRGDDHDIESITKASSASMKSKSNESRKTASSSKSISSTKSKKSSSKSIITSSSSSRVELTLKNNNENGKDNDDQSKITNKSTQSKKKNESEYEWHKLAVKAVSYIDLLIDKEEKDIISVAIIKALSQNGEILRNSNNDEATAVTGLSITHHDILSDAAVTASNLVLKSTFGNKELAVIAAKAILQAGYYTSNNDDSINERIMIAPNVNKTKSNNSTIESISRTESNISKSSRMSSKSKLSKRSTKSGKSSSSTKSSNIKKILDVDNDIDDNASEVYNDYFVLKERDDKEKHSSIKNNIVSNDVSEETYNEKNHKSTKKNKFNSLSSSQSYSSMIDSKGDNSSFHMSGCSVSGDESKMKNEIRSSAKKDVGDGIRTINKVLDNSSESLYDEEVHAVSTTSLPPTIKHQIKQPHHLQVNRVVDDNSVQSLFQKIGNTHHDGVSNTVQSSGVIDKTDYTSSTTNDSATILSNSISIKQESSTSILDSINESVPTSAQHKYMNATTSQSTTNDFNIAEKRRFRPIKEFLKYQKPKKYLNKLTSSSLSPGNNVSTATVINPAGIPMKRNKSNIGKVSSSRNNLNEEDSSSIEVWQDDNEEVITLYSDRGNTTTIEKVKLLNNPFKKPPRHNSMINNNVTVKVDLNTTTTSPIVSPTSIDNCSVTSSSIYIHYNQNENKDLSKLYDNEFIEKRNNSGSMDRNNNDSNNRTLDLPDYQSQFTTDDISSNRNSNIMRNKSNNSQKERVFDTLNTSKSSNIIKSMKIQTSAHNNSFDDTSVIILNPKEADIYLLEGTNKEINCLPDYDRSPSSSGSACEMFVETAKSKEVTKKGKNKKSFMGKLKLKLGK